MTGLLDVAIKAHGGMERWNEIRGLRVAASITGAIWFVKSQGDAFKDVLITAETRRQRVTFDFRGQDKRTVFEPTRVAVETAAGKLIAARDNPEQSFAGQQQDTPWDDVHAGYFCGEAIWTYLNTPFLYAQPGFRTEEIAPITVEGEVWRRLQIHFPDHVKSHTATQISCFGADGLLRRHDYTVDVLGGARGLNYADNYRNIGGIMIPATRRVYAWEGDYKPVMEPLLVAIDMGEISLL